MRRPRSRRASAIGEDQATGAYTQHYFDSRGVARLDAMTFDGTTWTLERVRADLMPLELSYHHASEHRCSDGDPLKNEGLHRYAG